jgi:hypothetical protein
MLFNNTAFFQYIHPPIQCSFAFRQCLWCLGLNVEYHCGMVDLASFRTVIMINTMEIGVFCILLGHKPAQECYTK